MSTARFFFWLFAVGLIAAGGFIIHPALGLLLSGLTILLQVLIGELHALYCSAIAVPKRK